MTAVQVTIDPTRGGLFSDLPRKLQKSAIGLGKMAHSLVQPLDRSSILWDVASRLIKLAIVVLGAIPVTALYLVGWLIGKVMPSDKPMTADETAKPASATVGTPSYSTADAARDVNEDVPGVAGRVAGSAILHSAGASVGEAPSILPSDASTATGIEVPAGVSAPSADEASQAAGTGVPKPTADELDRKPKKPEGVAQRLGRVIPLGSTKHKMPDSYLAKSIATLAKERDWILDIERVSKDWYEPDWQLRAPLLDVSTPYLVATVEAKGTRSSMEDATLTAQLTLARSQVSLFAVFDGHGGNAVANYLYANTALHFQESLHALESAYNTPLSELEDRLVEDALVKACIQLNEKIKGKIEAAMVGGSTMTMALVIGDSVWCVNSGDSRTLLVDAAGELIQMSQDADPGDESFKKSVEKRDGKVGKIFDSPDWRLAGGWGLAVARAFGDFDTPGISARPKITKRALGQGFMLFCDGFTEVFSSKQMGEYFLQALHGSKPLDQSAYELALAALLANTRDNLSVMLIDTRAKRLADAPMPISWTPRKAEVSA